MENHSSKQTSKSSEKEKYEALLKRVRQDNSKAKAPLSVDEQLTNAKIKIAVLKSENEQLRKMIFGQRSENLAMLNSSQPELFDPSEFAATEDDDDDLPKNPPREKKPPRQRKKKNEPVFLENIPDHLRVEERTIEPPEKELWEKQGKNLIKMEGSTVDYLAMTAPEAYIKRYHYPKYMVKEGDKAIFLQAPAIDTGLGKNKCDVSVMVFLIIMKSGFHMPLNRLHEYYRQLDLNIPRQTLCNWFMSAADLLEPLAVAIQRLVLLTNHIYTDDTTLKQKTRTGVILARMWVYAAAVGPPYRFFQFTDSREQKHVFEVLSIFSGQFMADAYTAYRNIDKSKEFDVRWCACWAHTRRKFVDALDGDKDFREKVLRKMGRLYLWERLGWQNTRELRMKIRRKKMRPLAEKLFDFVIEYFTSCDSLPSDKITEAMKYMIAYRDALMRAIDNVDMRIDNNTAERALRPLTIGRKNWLFAGSERGGKALATLLTIVQSCREIGVEPNAYLTMTLKTLQTHPASQIDTLLPHHYRECRGEQAMKDMADKLLQEIEVA